MLECIGDRLRTIEIHIVVGDSPGVVLRLLQIRLVIGVHALEERHQTSPGLGVHPLEPHTDDGPPVDFAEIEAEGGLRPERGAGPEEIVLLWDGAHEVLDVSPLRVHGIPICIEIRSSCQSLGL